jgi:hypothetical protein
MATLAELTTGLPQRGQWRDQFALADMNGDGHVDLVHGPPRKGVPLPVIFLGDGTGHFRRWSDTSFPPLPYDYGAVATADVNGDGMIDIALSSHLRGIVVMIAEGGGHFAPWSEGLELADTKGLSPEQMTSRAIALADWNHDGKPDLVVLSEGPAQFTVERGSAAGLVVFLNRNGYWQKLAPPSPEPFFGTALAIADINRDGFLDALTGSAVAGYRRLLRFGTATGWKTVEIASLPSNAFVTAVAVANGSMYVAYTNVVEGEWRVALARMRWRRSGLAADEIWSERATDAIASLTTADIDGDGRQDLIALRRDGSLLLCTGKHPPRVTAAPARLHGCSGYHVAAADIDGDGRPEIIASYAGEGASLGGAERCANGGGFATWKAQ